MLLIGFALLIFALCFLPWRQFISGNGRVIAFDPLERRINIEAQLSGRVKHLHVTEGQRVKMGDLFARVYDGRVSAWYPAFLEGALTRVHFVIGRYSGATPNPSQEELEAAVR
jgi:NAD-specific glutamate dehydrogenase